MLYYIIIRDNEKRTCILIDVAISGASNVINKVAEKNLKYKYLTIEYVEYVECENNSYTSVIFDNCIIYNNKYF